ncbi:MAG: glycoside hydrolase N-terminal domain-containing protein [Verrucomicrobiota bacterium]
MNWKEAFPLGNGRVGALVHGRIDSEVVTLNHERLWGDGCIKDLPDIRCFLPQIRQLLENGDYQSADRLYTEELVEKGYTGAAVAAFMPGPDLLIGSRVDAGFSDYLRTLNFETGEAAVRWTAKGHQRERRMFVSTVENILACDFSVSASGGLRHGVSLAPHDFRDSVTQSLELLTLTVKATHTQFPDGMGLEVDLGNGCCYAAAFQIRNSGNFSEVDGVLVCDFGPETMILCGVAPLEGPDSADCAAIYSRLVHIEGDYDSLRARHKKQHQILLGGIELDFGCSQEECGLSNEELLLDAYSGRIPNVLAEKLFHYGRYLLACSSRNCALPAHLQGLWNGDYSPPWRCAYFNNENLQMSYWQALVGNQAASLLPVFDLYESRMKDFRINARNLFGCRGILLPLYMSPENGLQKDLQPHVLYWTGAGAWLSQLYWEYWLFTNDRDFLSRRALPFMKEVALFYEDFVVTLPGGELISIYPGNSPENCANPHQTAVCINATLDVALVRELLGNLLTAYEELALSGAETERWREILRKLPPYAVDGDGALREWLHPDFGENHNHRHISHIYPFFPGHEIPPEPGNHLFRAVKESVERRMSIGIGDQTGWSLLHLANIFGRLGEGERAWECLGYLAQSCLGTSFFTYHNDVRGMGVTLQMYSGVGPALQLDAILGFPAAVIEMLLYSSSAEIRVLPALPKAWSEGSVSNLQTRCGVEVSLKWSRASNLVEVEFHACRKTKFRLLVPAEFGQQQSAERNFHEQTIQMNQGEILRMVSRKGGNHLISRPAEIADTELVH